MDIDQLLRAVAIVLGLNAELTGPTGAGVARRAAS